MNKGKTKIASLAIITSPTIMACLMLYLKMVQSKSFHHGAWANYLMEHSLAIITTLLVSSMIILVIATIETNTVEKFIAALMPPLITLTYTKMLYDTPLPLSIALTLIVIVPMIIMTALRTGEIKSLDEGEP